jgi:hypothetical protein
MDQNDGAAKPEHGQFDKTRWSVILEAMQRFQTPNALLKVIPMVTLGALRRDR